MTHLTVGSFYLNEGEKRLDGTYYALALKIRRELEHSQWPLIPLSQLATFTYLGRFKRHFVDYKIGVPLLGSREIFFWPPKAEKFLHPHSVSNKLFAQEKDILLSCSGTVGHALLAGTSIRGMAISQHVLRIHPKDKDEVGYIYAFIRSSYGFTFIQGSQFGAVIKEIEPQQLSLLPVPMLPPLFRKQIHNKMLRSLTLRERGVCLLKKAERLLYNRLGLPFLDNIEPEYLSMSFGKKVRAFTVSSNKLKGRLDGSYHLSEVESVLRVIKEGPYPILNLGELTKYVTIPPRFKRHYVDERSGIPYVRPSDLSTIRVLEPRYIVQWTPELSHLRLNKGEILISTDGSIGDLGYVTDAWDSWAGSNNIGRIMVDSDKVHPGYILAFLASPYGQIQLKREIYGGVIDHLEVSHIKGVCIPLPPLEVQETIGDRVLMAYTLRDKANALEEEAIAELEQAISHEAKLRLIQCRNV